MYSEHKQYLHFTEKCIRHIIIVLIRHYGPNKKGNIEKKLDLSCSVASIACICYADVWNAPVNLPSSNKVQVHCVGDGSGTLEL